MHKLAQVGHHSELRTPTHKEQHIGPSGPSSSPCWWLCSCLCSWHARHCCSHIVQVFHWLVEDRVDYIEVTPSVSRLAHVRIVSFLLVLLVRHTGCMAPRTTLKLQPVQTVLWFLLELVQLPAC